MTVASQDEFEHRRDGGVRKWHLVIDAKRYQKRPQLRVGGRHPRTKILRDWLWAAETARNLVDGVLEEVELVATAIHETLPDLTVHGMRCTVEADWPLIGGTFSTRHVEMLCAVRSPLHARCPTIWRARSGLAHDRPEHQVSHRRQRRPWPRVHPAPDVTLGPPGRHASTPTLDYPWCHPATVAQPCTHDNEPSRSTDRSRRWPAQEPFHGDRRLDRPPSVSAGLSVETPETRVIARLLQGLRAGRSTILVVLGEAPEAESPALLNHAARQPARSGGLAEPLRDSRAGDDRVR